MLRAFRLLACAVIAWTAPQAPAAGAGVDDFPSRTVRIIVPFPAGSSADLRTRLLGPLLSERLRQPVIIENRPGAAGSIGTAAGAKAVPDGHTLLYVVTNTVAVAPHVFKNVGFDPQKDLIPLIVALRASPALVVRPDSPLRSVTDLIAQARAAPGRLTYGTSGPGSPQHVMGERLKRLAGIDLTPVHYKGDAPTLVDLMGGHIDCAFGFGPAALPLIESGKLRALAVAGATRLSPLPEVPTLAEAGVIHFDESIWAGYAVPAGTPAERVRRLHDALQSAMLTPAFRADVARTGSELVASSQAVAVQMLNADFARYAAIVKELGLKVE